MISWPQHITFPRVNMMFPRINISWPRHIIRFQRVNVMATTKLSELNISPLVHCSGDRWLLKNVFVIKSFIQEIRSKMLIQLGLDQNIRLFEYSYGGLAFDFQFWDSNILFFFNTWHPRKMVLNLSAWLNICNRPFANERRSCWPIACIYFMKNLLLWARLPHIYIWNNEQKTRHVNGPSAITKPNVMHAFSFCQLSRDTSESLGSACSSSCSADEMRWCEAALREWKREDAVQLNHSHCFQMTDLIWQFVWIYLLL